MARDRRRSGEFDTRGRLTPALQGHWAENVIYPVARARYRYRGYSRSYFGLHPIRCVPGVPVTWGITASTHSACGPNLLFEQP